MKKYYQILFVILTSFIFTNKSIISNAEESFESIQEIDIERTNTNVSKTDRIIYFQDDLLIEQIMKENMPFLSISQNGIIHVELPGIIICHLIKNNKLYVLIDKLTSYFYIIDLTTYQINSKQFDQIYTFNDFVIYDNYLVFVGSNENDACIMYLSQKLDLVSCKTYDAEGKQALRYIVIKGNEIIVVGIKDAISDTNKYYKNVGDLNLTKSFLWVLNAQNEPVFSQYFNISNKSEIITHLKYQNGLLSLLIDVEGSKYSFTYDNIKENPIEQKIEDDKLEYLFSYGNCIQIAKEEDIYWQCDQTRFIIDKGDYLGYRLNDDLLEVYIRNDEYLDVATISQYQIEYLNEVTIDNLNLFSDINKQIKVNSYFQEITLTMTSSNPVFDFQINGRYDVIYSFSNYFGIHNFPAKIIVDDYTNVIEGGIYRTGSQLLFKGYAYLNDLRVFNGHVLANSGEQLLKIIDANGNVEIINFRIVDDFYRNIMDNTTKVDKQIFPNEKAIFNYIVPEHHEIKQLIINGKEYYDWKQVDNLLTISINSTVPYSIDTYYLNSISYLVDEVLITKPGNLCFRIKTLAVPLTINISNDSDIDNTILISIDDPHDTLVDLQFIIDNQKIVNTSLQNYTLVLNDLNDQKKHTIEARISTTNGDNVIKTIELFTYEGLVKMQQASLLDVKYQKGASNHLLSITFNNSEFDTQKLNVQGVELKHNLISKSNNIYLWLSTGLTLISLIIFGILFYYKHHKKRYKK